MSESFTLTLLSFGKVSEQQFDVKKDELILDAANRQNVKIPYSCRNGTCRTCIVQVRFGTVTQEDSEFCLISQSELDDGKRLICMSTAQSEAVLEKIGSRVGK